MDLLTQLKRDEGIKYWPYLDTCGNETIGIGHKILPGENFSWAIAISETQAEQICLSDIAKAQGALGQFDWYNGLDPIRQAAITNMTFNLGLGGMLEFHNLITCLENADWLGAHDQALNSTWARQVGDRAKRVAEQLQTGEWV